MEWINFNSILIRVRDIHYIKLVRCVEDKGEGVESRALKLKSEYYEETQVYKNKQAALTAMDNILSLLNRNQI